MAVFKMQTDVEPIISKKKDENGRLRVFGELMTRIICPHCWHVRMLRGVETGVMECEACGKEFRVI